MGLFSGHLSLLRHSVGQAKPVGMALRLKMPLIKMPQKAQRWLPAAQGFHRHSIYPQGYFVIAGLWPSASGTATDVTSPIVKKTGVSPLFSKDCTEAADELTETTVKPCDKQLRRGAMLTMPSVSSASNLVSRPVLVVDVVRPVAPQRAIEPTTAVSKERSRADNKAPDTSMAAAGALYTPSGKSKAADPRNGTNASNAEAARAEEARNKEQPPVEKSEIQQAMEAQIKELLSNVWKASAKAVDFLLQRESEAAGQNPLTTLEPAALLGKKASAAAGGAEVPAKGALTSYNAQGGRLSEETAAAGQLLDVLA